MLNVSQGFINAIQENVKYREMQFLEVSDDQNMTNSIEVREGITSSQSLEGRIHKTNMRSAEIELKGYYDYQGKYIVINRGAIPMSNITQDYWMKYNIMRVVDVEYDDASEKTKLLLKDLMVSTHKSYNPTDLNLAFPATVIEVFKRIAIVCDLETSVTSFPNSDIVISEDKWANNEWTYRDVLDEIAEISGSQIGIRNNKLDVWQFEETGLEIDLNRSDSLIVGESFDKFNILNITREPQHDNYAYPENWNTIPVANRKEWNITNNQILDKDRERLAPLIFPLIKDVSYTEYENKSKGWGIFDVGDVVTIRTRDDQLIKTIVTYESIEFSGMCISTNGAKKSESIKGQYAISSDVRRLGITTYLLVDQQNGKIEALVQEQSEQADKISKLEIDMDSLTATVSKISNEENIMPNANGLLGTPNIEKLIPNGWDSFVPFGNIGIKTKAPIEVFETGYVKNFLPTTSTYWEQGSIASADGTNFNSPLRIRSSSFYEYVPEEFFYIYCPNYYIGVMQYDEQGNFISTSGWQKNKRVNVESGLFKYRIILKINDSDPISVDDINDKEIGLYFDNESNVFFKAWQDFEKDELVVDGWDNMAILKTPLENGLTHIQTWGGNSQIKMLYALGTGNEGLHTLSTYFKPLNGTYVRPYFQGIPLFEVVTEGKNVVLTGEINPLINAQYRITTSSINDNLDFIASEPLLYKVTDDIYPFWQQNNFIFKQDKNSLSETVQEFYKAGSGTNAWGHIVPGAPYFLRFKRFEGTQSLKVRVHEYANENDEEPIAIQEWNITQPATYNEKEFNFSPNTYWIKVEWITTSNTKFSIGEVMFTRNRVTDYKDNSKDILYWSEGKFLVMNDKIETVVEDVRGVDGKTEENKSQILQQSSLIDINTQKVDKVSGDIHNAGLEINAVDGVSVYGDKFKVMDSERTRTLMEVVTEDDIDKVIINGELTAGKVGDMIIENGALSREYSERTKTYTQADLDRIQSILQKQITPTEQDFIDYDLDGNGNIDVSDLVLVRKIITDGPNPTDIIFRVIVGDELSRVETEREIVGVAKFKTIIKGNGIETGSIVTSRIHNSPPPEGGAEILLGPTNLILRNYSSSEFRIGSQIWIEDGSIHATTNEFSVSDTLNVFNRYRLFGKTVIDADGDTQEPKGNFYRINPRAGNGGSIGLSSNRYSTIFLRENPNVSSDPRQKKMIQDIPIELIERIGSIQPKKYVQEGNVHFGYIATDIERELYKYCVNKYGYKNAQLGMERYSFLYKDESYLSLLYGEIQVIKDSYYKNKFKEQDKAINGLQSQINELYDIIKKEREGK